MINAYQEIYVHKTQALLGDAFDYAINVYKLLPNDFINLFLVSSFSKQIENGEALGRSGIELVHDIIFELKGEELDPKIIPRYSRSREYWCGWVIAYYQWYSDRSFNEILTALPFSDLQKLYITLHEADISKSVEIIESKVKEYYPDTKLKRFRMINKMTQKQLSIESGVSLRSIQMYEQRNKDINNASILTVYKLSKVLGCKAEDLIEK